MMAVFNEDKIKRVDEVKRSMSYEAEVIASVLDIPIDMMRSTLTLYTKPTCRHQLYLQESCCSPCSACSGVPIQREYSSGYSLDCATPWMIDNSEWP